MTCSAPPPLTPDQLSAAIDGDAPSDVRDHLSHCAYCAARLADARAVEQQFGQQLFRWDCPTPQQLADYHLGLAESTDAARIAAHLAGCARCQPELAELQAFLSNEPAREAAPPERKPPPGWRDLLARLLSPTPSLALRGEVRAPFMAQAGNVLIVLDVQSVGEGSISLLGQLTAPDPAHWTGALVQLRQAGALAHTAIVNDLGDFVLPAVSPGSFELRITPPAGAAIVVPPVELGGPGAWKLSSS